MTKSLPRRWICRLLIGVLVSTQMALAAYACGGFARELMHAEVPAGTAMAMGRSGAAEPAGSDRGIAMNPDTGTDDGCSRLDPALPNLCVAQHQYGQQSAEHSPAPTVATAWLVSLYPLPATSENSARARLGWGPGHAVPTPDPPHAVLHCCLRI
jgi:hypothetical protein